MVLIDTTLYSYIHIYAAVMRPIMQPPKSFFCEHTYVVHTHFLNVADPDRRHFTKAGLLAKFQFLISTVLLAIMLGVYIAYN